MANNDTALNEHVIRLVNETGETAAALAAAVVVALVVAALCWRHGRPKAAAVLAALAFFGAASAGVFWKLEKMDRWIQSTQGWVIAVHTDLASTNDDLASMKNDLARVEESVVQPSRGIFGSRTMHERLDAIAADVKTLDKQVEGVEASIGSPAWLGPDVHDRLAEIERVATQRLDSIESRLDSIESDVALLWDIEGHLSRLLRQGP